MRTFKDSEGREWRVAVNVTTIKRVRDLAGVDLMQAVEGKLLESLAGDPIKLGDTIYALCQPQAEERGITDVQFGEALAGDAIDAATEALLEDLVDFFPKAKRGVLRKATEKLRAMEAKVVQAFDVKIDSGIIERTVDAQLEDAMRQLDELGGGSTNSPAASA